MWKSAHVSCNPLKASKLISTTDMALEHKSVRFGAGEKGPQLTSLGREHQGRIFCMVQGLAKSVPMTGNTGRAAANIVSGFSKWTAMASAGRAV